MRTFKIDADLRGSKRGLTRMKVPRISAYFPRLSASIFLLISGLFLEFPSARAAELYFEPLTGTYSSESLLPLELRIDTQDEKINALEVQLEFSSEFLQIEEIWDGSSIINFWIDKPQVSGSKLTFSGIIPGGYQGQSGLLLKLLLKPLSESSSKISYSPTTLVLLNDGQGSKAELMLKASDLKFELSGRSVSIEPDQQPPEPFRLSVTKDPKIFGGQWFVTFATADKASGLDHYEILETRDQTDLISDQVSWTKADSPYLLQDQLRESYIFVKAIDKSGNTRLSHLPPLPAEPFDYRKSLIWIIIMILLLAAWLILKRRGNKKKKS